MKKVKENNIVKLILTIAIGIILLILGSTNEHIGKMLGNVNTYQDIEKVQLEGLTISYGENVIKEITNTSNLKVYYFDVGQADSILVVNNNKTMLIDAGNNDDGELIVNNIKKLGISKLDYVIGTHPHEDHIGGLDNVIDAFDIGTIYMPKVQANTKTFEDVLDSISNKGLTITAPQIGDKFQVGNANCEVMSTGEDSSNLNSTSIVIRMQYNNKSYLFMGDAEKINESTREWPETDIIKVGHHGSSTSSSQRFLNQVKPKIAIIQLGKGNKYGHPHDEVIKRLEKMNVAIYRTDLQKDILIEQE
ncbi:MAG: MBL fold metallo-hydrolase [Clostridia bacterium]|nr:MBL fold metallo-hydrolase [Clostridia bacterium]